MKGTVLFGLGILVGVAFSQGGAALDGHVRGLNHVGIVVQDYTLKVDLLGRLVTHLRVGDIDGSRMTIRVQQGKGRKRPVHDSCSQSTGSVTPLLETVSVARLSVLWIQPGETAQ